MAIPELDILKPVDPSISNSDDYELFTLSNAQVYDPKTGKPANLLDAYADSPVTVEGKLDPPSREQQQCLVRRPYNKAVTIEVKNVTRFSWAQTLKTGEIIIWALGSSGWLEIRPSRVYRDKYQEMVQAVEILYFAADIYSQARKRGGGPSAELLFQEYAEDSRFESNSKEEAAEVFYSHKSFLIEAMLKRSEGIGWSNTPLYQHFKSRFPVDFQAVRDKISEKADVSSKKQSKAKSSGAATSSRSTQPPKKAASSKKEKPANAPKKDDNWWEATAVWELMQKAFAQGHLKPGEVTISSVAKAMVKKYEIDSEEQAEHYLRVHGSNLRYIMQHPRRRTMLHFIHESIFEELATNLLPAATIRIASQMVLLPRKAPLDQVSSEDDTSDQSSSSDDGTRRHRHSHKGKYSGLRPKSSKGAGKGNKGTKGKTTAPIPIVNEPDEDDSEDGEPMELSSPSKRKASVDERLANPRKRAASESNDLNSPPSSPSSSTDEAVGDPLPLRWKNSQAGSVKSTSPAFLPSIISSPLPSYAANGPGDSFMCTFDGCTHKVYGASTDTGKALIKEHLQEHASRGQEQLELVISEEQRSRLPVSNLIKRIREMANAQQTTFQLPGMASAAPVPTAIERRY